MLRIDRQGRLPYEPHCPFCRTVLDGFSQVRSDDEEPGTPDPGDLTVCGYCGVLLIFGGDKAFEVMSRTFEAKLREEHPDQWQLLDHLRTCVRALKQ